MENLGMRVRIQLETSVEQIILHNITEIHYNYPSLQGHERVAFESDIHGVGFTHDVKDIKEFEAMIETTLWKHIT